MESNVILPEFRQGDHIFYVQLFTKVGLKGLKELLTAHPIPPRKVRPSRNKNFLRTYFMSILDLCPFFDLVSMFTYVNARINARFFKNTLTEKDFHVHPVCFLLYFCSEGSNKDDISQ